MFQLLHFIVDSLLSDMFKSPQKRLQPDALPSLDRASLQLASLGLQCLSHLFSWVPLSTTITPQLLSTIFHFAAFGCEVKADVTSGSQNSSFASPGAEVGVFLFNISFTVYTECISPSFPSLACCKRSFRVKSANLKKSSSITISDFLHFAADERFIIHEKILKN